MTAVYPAASTAAITVVSSTCSSALTVSRPLRALTSTPVTPGSCATASRTDASHPPQLIPVTTYSLVRIIVLLLISWCCHSSCTETLYPYGVYFNSSTRLVESLRPGRTPFPGGPCQEALRVLSPARQEAASALGTPDPWTTASRGAGRNLGAATRSSWRGRVAQYAVVQNCSPSPRP